MAEVTRIIARVIGGPTIEMVRDPGVDGADQIDATWSVGKEAVLSDDKLLGELHVFRARCVDWFQPDSNLALTIYTFEYVASVSRNQGGKDDA